jgi:glycosyltransferase involved in cell wall biosynthesis
LNYPLVLVGDGDVRQELERMVNSMGLQKQVFFVGQVSPIYLPEISRRARIGYNVSENLGLSYFYSLNNKFFDYVEAELPSVINDFPEYIEHCKEFSVGILVSNANQEIADSLKKLMEDDEAYQKIKNQCALARNVWNWECEKQILIDIYQEFKQ